MQELEGPEQAVELDESGLALPGALPAAIVNTLQVGTCGSRPAQPSPAQSDAC